MNLPVDVSADGTVHLSHDVVCDGFYRDAEFRVQTHVHADHLRGFDSSKGFQRILMSRASRRLLCVEKNADIPYRSNIEAVETKKEYGYGGGSIKLIPSGHMLGGVQVRVERDDGLTVGYSSDFAWPLSCPIDVDVLVVDSTYGRPTSVREYTQGECDQAFIDLVRERLEEGPIYLYSHRGTLQRALQLIETRVEVPVFATRSTNERIKVFKEHGYTIGDIETVAGGRADQRPTDGRFIQVFSTGDKRPVDPEGATVIKLSAYFTRPDSPVLEYSPKAFGVALSDHADFEGTLSYVAATGADLVITDNSRGGHALELADYIKEELGIEAIPSTNRRSYEWGQ